MYYSISILFTSCNLLLQMEAHAAKIGLVPSFNIDTHGFDWEQFYFSYFLSNISEYLLQHINGKDGRMETIVAYMRIEMRCSIDPCSPEKLYKTPELYDNLTKPLSHTVFSEISQILKKRMWIGKLMRNLIQTFPSLSASSVRQCDPVLCRARQLLHLTTTK